MAKVTIAFGVLLIVIGAGFYMATVPHAPTALIPLLFGGFLAGLGSISQTNDAKRRALFMHIAVTMKLIGFLFPFIMAFPRALKMMRGMAVARPVAVEEQMLMALVCLIFTGLCVRSFIEARRSRI